MNSPLSNGAALDAVHDAQRFLRRHGDGLSEVLHLLGGDPALDLFCDTTRLLETLSPDPQAVGRAFHRMHVILRSADHPGEGLDPSLRWHGARLSEFTARLTG